jgi:hypothetical protein
MKSDLAIAALIRSRMTELRLSRGKFLKRLGSRRPEAAPMELGLHDFETRFPGIAMSGANAADKFLIARELLDPLHPGSGEVGTSNPDAAFGISFQPGETEVNLLAHFFRLVSAEWRSEEDRAALVGRSNRDELRNAQENPAGFLGSAPEKRRVRVLAVEIDHDPKGFMELEIAVASAGTRRCTSSLAAAPSGMRRRG